MVLAGVVVIFINILPGGLLEVLYEKATEEK
jgi:hypothetical protein